MQYNDAEKPCLRGRGGAFVQLWWPSGKSCISSGRIMATFLILVSCLIDCEDDDPFFRCTCISSFEVVSNLRSYYNQAYPIPNLNLGFGIFNSSSVSEPEFLQCPSTKQEPPNIWSQKKFIEFFVPSDLPSFSLFSLLMRVQKPNVLVNATPLTGKILSSLLV